MGDSLDIVRLWIDTVWNAGELDQLESLHPPIFLNEGKPSTPNEAKRWHQELHKTFPDVNFTIEDLFGIEDKVVVRWTASGTQQGTLWGFILPTGKKIEWKGVHIVRVEDSKIVEVWAVSNQAAILQQLGVQFVVPESDP